MKMAAGYARVSSRRQMDHGYSIEDQKNRIKAWCDARQFDLIKVIEDPGKSARSKRREGLRHLKQLVKEKAIDVIVCVDLDRLFRDTVSTLRFNKKCERRGISLNFINQVMDCSTPEGELQLTVIAAFGRYESRKNGQRVKRIVEHLKEKGKCVGQVPFGYWKDEEGNLHKHELEQEEIAFMIDNRLGGWTFQHIADNLNDRKIPTKNGSAKWTAKKVSNVVRREGIA